MDFAIESVEAIEAQKGTVALALGGITVGGRAGGYAAKVAKSIDGKTVSLGLSKLDGETEWIVDSMFVGGAPAFVNGVGSRCTRLKALSCAETCAALDAATAELGG